MTELRQSNQLELPKPELRDDALSRVSQCGFYLRAAELVLSMTDEERARWESGEAHEDDPVMSFICSVDHAWGDPRAFVTAIQINLMLSLEILEMCGRDPGREAREMLDAREVDSSD